MNCARVMCEKLPTWTRNAAEIDRQFGGSISRRSFLARHIAKRFKEIASGRYPLLEENGSALLLTTLGRKIAMIEDQRCIS